jgi:hypothetical protein
MTNAIINQIAAGYSGKNHVLITREEAEQLIIAERGELPLRIRVGVPDKTYPDNYVFTVSSYEHCEGHVKCGTPFSVNAFFITDEKDNSINK